MRSLNAELEAAISGKELSLTELYDFTLNDGTLLYLTSLNEDIIWGGQTYTSVPITRSPIQQQMNLEMDTVTVQLERISTGLANAVENGLLDGVNITIKRAVYSGDAGAGATQTVFVGTGTPEYDRSRLTLRCVCILDSLNIVVPQHIYEEACNNRLFDDSCGLTMADHKYSSAATSDADDCFTVVDSKLPVYKVAFDGGDDTAPVEIADEITGGDNAYTATVVGISYVTAAAGYIYYLGLSNPANFDDDEVLTGGGNTVTVNGTPAEDTTFYALAEIRILDGDNEGLRRMVRAASGTSLYVAIPFSSEIVTDVTYDIYSACDKKPETCRDKFNNADQFRGFVYIPRADESLYGESR